MLMSVEKERLISFLAHIGEAHYLSPNHHFASGSGDAKSVASQVETCWNSASLRTVAKMVTHYRGRTAELTEYFIDPHFPK